jgi:hypothetical protein
LTLRDGQPYDPTHSSSAPHETISPAEEPIMPDISVEEAVNANCQAVLAGDLMRIMNDLTPEALSQVMANAGGGGGMGGAMPALTSFDIESHDVSGDDHNFQVRFKGDQEFVARATWRDVGGQWKIAALSMEQ